MSVVVLTVIFSTIVAKICSTGLIVDNRDLHQTEIIEKSIDVLELCYAKRFDTIGLAGPSIGCLIEIMSSRGNVVPVVSMYETSGSASKNPIGRASPNKLQFFMVTVIDSSKLAETLVQVKNSKWWNHMAFFFLIDWSKAIDGCSRAYEILWQAWRMNLLNSKFMCRHPTRGMLIYTFNPYTSKAPIPWQQENTYEGMGGHVWTLFVREYRQDDSRCDALDFDKTSDLGGYKIGAAVRGVENWKMVDPKKLPKARYRVARLTAWLLMSFLNAKWTFSTHEEDDLGPFDSRGNPRGMLADVGSHNSDICLNTWSYQFFHSSVRTTYPHYAVSVMVMTQYRGHTSQFQKLISVFDKSSRCCVLVVLFVTLLFFKFWLRKPLIPAILDLVLIMCNAALLKVPKKLASRIYLGSLSIVLVTIHGVYQGKLASLLTTQVRLPDVESIEDLARSEHTIYSPDNYYMFFEQSAFEGRWVGLNTINCTGQVLDDSNAACANSYYTIIDDAIQFNLHVSREPIGTIYGVYLIRPDWPLEERVNKIYERTIVSGIMALLYAKELKRDMLKVKSHENENQGQTLKVLTLKHLSFAFVMLRVGLGCATISFIIEVAYQNRHIRERVRLLLNRSSSSQKRTRLHRFQSTQVNE